MHIKLAFFLRLVAPTADHVLLRYNVPFTRSRIKITLGTQILVPILSWYLSVSTQ